MDGLDWPPRVDRAAVARYLPGDLLAILAFLVAGELRHNIDPVTYPGLFAETALPFFVGWLLLAPLAGAYDGRATASVGGLLLRAAVAWVGAAAVGVALRGTAVLHGTASPVFFLVAVGIGLLLLLPVRAAVFVRS